MLFLVHAYGARMWRPGEGSKQARAPIRPSEHDCQAPAGLAQLYMDGPWRLQWPCLIPWALMQVAHSVAWITAAIGMAPLLARLLTCLLLACLCCITVFASVALLGAVCCSPSFPQYVVGSHFRGMRCLENTLECNGIPGKDEAQSAQPYCSL